MPYWAKCLKADKVPRNEEQQYQQKDVARNKGTVYSGIVNGFEVDVENLFK